LFFLSILPLVALGSLLIWAIFALLRHGGDGAFEHFADAVFTWAGSVVGIWLGLAIVGSILGLVCGVVVFTVVLGAIQLLQPFSPWFIKLLLTALVAAVVFIYILWHFLSLSFLRR